MYLLVHSFVCEKEMSVLGAIEGHFALELNYIPTRTSVLLSSMLHVMDLKYVWRGIIKVFYKISTLDSGSHNDIMLRYL